MISKDKKEIINKVIEAIQIEATFVRESEELSLETKCDQMDVLLDVYHFLREYEKNVKILNDYDAQHRFDKEK